MSHSVVRGMALLMGSGVLLLAGCGEDGQGRQAVSGTVSFRGEPLDQGIIEFLPTGPEPVTPAAAPIQGGSYGIPRGKGLAPGTYKVMISSGEPGTRAEEEAPGESLGVNNRERIPAKYNEQTTLTVEVRQGEPGKFDFDLR